MKEEAGLFIICLEKEQMNDYGRMSVDDTDNRDNCGGLINKMIN